MTTRGNCYDVRAVIEDFARDGTEELTLFVARELEWYEIRFVKGLLTRDRMRVILLDEWEDVVRVEEGAFASATRFSLNSLQC